MNIPVVSEENEVPLVVESYNTSSLEIRILGKNCSQHSSNGATQSSREMIQNNFWIVRSWDSVTTYLPPPLVISQLEISRGSIR